MYFYLSSGNTTPDQNAGQSPSSNQSANQNIGKNLVEDLELIPYSKGGKFGFCDKEKKLVIEAKYAYVEPFSNNLALVNIGMKMNETGEIVEPGTYGFIDKTGKEIIPLKYKYATSFSEGLAFVTSQLNVQKPYGDNYGKNPADLIIFGRKGGMFIDVKENPVFTVKYDYASSFVEGFSKVVNRIPGKKGYYKMGFIDKTGKEVVPLIYDYVDQFSEGLALVSVDTKKAPKVGFIDVTGKVVIPLKFNSRYSKFSDGLAVQRTDEGYVLINKLGEVVYKPLWERNIQINEFSEGYATAYKPEIERMGFLDKDGQEISFKYIVVRGFKDGLALVRGGRELGYKSGYIDKTGREVIPIKYDEANGDFSNGLAYVRLGKYTFYLDKKGTEYYEP